VRVNEGAADGVRAALVRHPVKLAVEVVEDGDGAEDANGAAALVLDGRAVYVPGSIPPPGGGRTPEPVLRVRSPADAAEAERLLYAQIRKSVDGDGFVAHHVIRPLTRPLTRVLLGTRVSPNQVTVLALLCAVAAAVLAAAGGLRNAALAGLLYWIGNALDCVDGDIARLRLQSSKLGEWLDSMTDEISTFSLLAGLGVGLWRDGAGAGWLWIGVGGSVVGALTVARLYVDLHRMGLPIDSAQFPWFFARPEAAQGGAGRSGLGQFFYVLGFLIRRDANVTGVSAMLLLGWRELATALVAAGAAIGALVTITHYLVMALRRPARTPR
jgi:phosphatidylglycerophosphate synthase